MYYSNQMNIHGTVGGCSVRLPYLSVGGAYYPQQSLPVAPPVRTTGNFPMPTIPTALLAGRVYGAPTMHGVWGQ